MEIQTLVAVFESSEMFILKVLISLWLVAAGSCQCKCKIKKENECSANEVFLTDNPYRCQSKCAMYGVSVNCKENFAPKGDCYCRPGYARYYDCGFCIPLSHPICLLLGKDVIPSEKLCSQRPNEEYSASGGRTCRNTCIDYNTKECMATTMPVPGPFIPVCECKDGFARLPSGECVDALDPRCYEYYKPTPERCAKLGKLYSPFGSACQQGCKDYNPETNLCLQDQSSKPAAEKLMILTEACYCPKGTAVDYQGRCFPIESCPFD